MPDSMSRCGARSVPAHRTTEGDCAMLRRPSTSVYSTPVTAWLWITTRRGRWHRCGAAGVEMAARGADPFAVANVAVQETDAVAACPVEVTVEVEPFRHSRRDEGERDGVEVGRRGHGHGAARTEERGRAESVVLHAAQEGEHLGPAPSGHTRLAQLS
jgi:hypothetical protein